LRRDGLGNADDLVAAQVVEQDYVVRPQGWRQDLLDVSAEAFAIDGAVEEAGCGDAAATQAGDQRGYLSMPMRHRRQQASPRAARPRRRVILVVAQVS
jgi:hypothetical protein